MPEAPITLSQEGKGFHPLYPLRKSERDDRRHRPHLHGAVGGPSHAQPQSTRPPWWHWQANHATAAPLTQHFLRRQLIVWAPLATPP
jgi:hypothetical protein